MSYHGRSSYGQPFVKTEGLEAVDVGLIQDAELSAMSIVRASTELFTEEQLDTFRESAHMDWARTSAGVVIAGLRRAGIINESTDIEGFREAMQEITNESISKHRGAQ